jgi:hypothetical protein
MNYCREVGSYNRKENTAEEERPRRRKETATGLYDVRLTVWM